MNAPDKVGRYIVSDNPVKSHKSSYIGPLAQHQFNTELLLN